MGTSIAALCVMAIMFQVEGNTRLSGFAQELKYQQTAFQTWWEVDLETRADKLPESGAVPDFRIPYSGHDYPDRGGGTIQALRKYDAAYHRGRHTAAEYERRDVGAHRGQLSDEPLGLFARLRAIRMANRAPSWYGHCNGWTSAAIRHAEPQRSVVRNGVTFTPADIKGLLAEIYMYSQTEFLGGNDAVIDPALMHLVLTNWLGRGAHPVGVETAIGEVVINYPIYAYKSTTRKLSDRQTEVKMTVTYAVNTSGEANRSPRLNKSLYFHYVLDLDAEGHIKGGRYYNDSNRVDMLWVPRQPVQGGEPGNERGNPHVDVQEVLAIWRESVPEDLRNKWLNIDPTPEDRILTAEEATETTESEAPAATEAAAEAASAPTEAAPSPPPAAEPSNETPPAPPTP